MTPEQLVPARETCGRMMRAGWTKPTVFAWFEERAHAGVFTVGPRDIAGIYWRTAAPAPTAQEVADELPEGFAVSRDEGTWGTCAAYWSGEHKPLSEATDTNYATMVEALAGLWLALNEKGAER